MSQRTFHKSDNFKFNVSNLFVLAMHTAQVKAVYKGKKKGNIIHLCVLKPHRKESEIQPQCSINNNLQAKQYVMYYHQQIS